MKSLEEIKSTPNLVIEAEKQAFLSMTNMMGIQVNKWKYNKRASE